MEHNIHGDHVRVTKLSKVSPLSTPQNLSFFDQFLALAPPIRTLQLFSTVGLPFPTIVASLREGLSKALQHFLPLSGKLARCARGFKIRVVGEGEAYVLAEELVPRINVRDVPMEALAVQVTRVGEDGVAVGVAMYHVVGDGRPYWSFVKAWAEICRTGGLEARMAVGG
ncbi:Malonyl-coenzyme:anthocyanin 5-O-glucoside-6'''-O-malonyltransferase [Acorus calamus]|uniref:Malonyl-coenzyme:anthocyanin 5-O-glucoside-6'''-O-malonyltransferase n=1 Tax=Acorus calamus TaxID=4465 RepID=A0AAV9E3W4_ACOCL|nr:Malonyl-coenzyme:anthocyanin 5-O-glucoside-6'''-O-malonyltransferase [Acorus calamus]